MLAMWMELVAGADDIDDVDDVDELDDVDDADDADDSQEGGWPFTSFPVVDDDKRFLGLVTQDRLKFVEVPQP